MSDRSLSSGASLATPQTGWALFLILALLTNPGAVIGALMPTFVDAFVARGLEAGAAARLGSIELFSMAVTLVLAPLVVNRWDRRILGLCAIVIGATGQLGTIWADDPIVMGALRMMAGAGEGALYAVAVAAISSTSAPDRAFGVAVASNLIATTALLALCSSIALLAMGASPVSNRPLLLASL